MEASNSVDRVLRISAFVSLFIAMCLWVGPAVLRPDIFDGDAAHHVFWLYQYADPALFPNDISVEYLRTSAPLGYRALYLAIAPVVDVLFAQEVLSGVLFLIAGLLAWKIGTALEAPDRAVTGFIAVLACIAMVTISATSDLVPAMAFQRTFALPLTLLCLWALISHRYLWVGLSWVGAALFYPVLLPVLGLAGGGVFLWYLIQNRRMPPLWLANFALAVLALIFVLYFIPKVPWLGHAFDYAEASAMPEFGMNGRLQLHMNGFFAEYFRFHMMGLGWSAQFLLVIAAFTALALWLSRRLLPVEAWIFVGVGFAIWVAMRLFPEKLMFDLYLPNRHTRWAIAAFGIVAISAGGYALLDAAFRRVALRRTAVGLALLAPVLTAVVVWPHASSLMNKPVDQDLENTYAFISNLPSSTLVGAHPDLSSYIPLRSRRSVLTSTEVSMPWFQGYYAKARPRVEALLRAAYATRIEDVDAEMKPYGVDVFVTGPSVWQSTGYLEPFDKRVKELIARGKEQGYALQRPPEDRILFRSGDYYVIQVSK